MTHQFTVYLTLIFLTAFHTYSFSSTHARSEEERDFRTSIFVNGVLCQGTYEAPNVTRAWQHQKAIREMAQDPGTISMPIGPDGEINTLNRMGSHWGFAPSITVAVDRIVKDKEAVKMLEIGSCYGFDAIALIQKYPQLSIDSVELDPLHVAFAERVERNKLDWSQRTRLHMIAGNFMGEILDFKEEPVYDLVVISKVLHFYDDDDIVEFLIKVRRFMKPEASVVMTNGSNQAHSILKNASYYFGSYLPNPNTVLRAITCRGKLGWLYYFSKEDMERLAEEAGFKVTKNEYLGTVHNKNVESYWWIGGINIRQAILHTELTL